MELSVTDLSTLKLFTTYPHPCSYLPDQEAVTLFIDPEAEIDVALYSRLSEFGFRRSGPHLYRPRCGECQACIPMRIPVDMFSPNRKQRRCWRRNQDLEVNVLESIDTDEHYQLYDDYIRERHADGDMYPPSRQQYRDFLSTQWGSTCYLEFRHESRLVAVAVSDRLDHGLSAIYTFYAADQTARSLGAYAILYQIEWAKQLGLEHVYLGYWIKQCQKMRYKSDYRPFQLFVNNTWITAS
jgi:arginyl-tRNA--protein-N-Asp/Glu arginylyltransferase